MLLVHIGFVSKRQFQCAPTKNVDLINMCFPHRTGFSHITGFLQISQLIFMFQCNEHVEMNKFCAVWHAPV